MIDYQDLPDDAWQEFCDDKALRRYYAALRAHPHPSDPDHPEPEEYGLTYEDLE